MTAEFVHPAGDITVLRHQYQQWGDQDGMVTQTRVASVIRSFIPLDVEIDRTQVLLDKQDRRVKQHRYAMAVSLVAMRDTEAEYQHAEARCQYRLVQRVEMLRVRYQVQIPAADTEPGTIGDDDLSRATELANRIERELAVTKAQQTPSRKFTDTQPALADETDEFTLESEVDAVLRGQEAANSLPDSTT